MATKLAALTATDSPATLAVPSRRICGRAVPDAGTKRIELIAKSTGTVSEFSLDDRVFHQKFGYGQVVKIDGNKLTIAFEKAGEKKVVDSFVQRA